MVDLVTLKPNATKVRTCGDTQFKCWLIMSWGRWEKKQGEQEVQMREAGYLTFCKYKQTHAKSTCTVSSLLAQHIAVI